MAFKTVVVSAFVQQLAEFVQQMARSKGPFALAMLVPSETGLTEKWNLVLSAKWIDEEGLQAAIPSNSSLLLKHLSRGNATKIERISVLPTNDLLVTDLMQLDIAPGAAYRVDTLALTMREIHEAIILAAQRPRPGSQSRPQKVRVQG